MHRTRVVPECSFLTVEQHRQYKLAFGYILSSSYLLSCESLKCFAKSIISLALEVNLDTSQATIIVVYSLFTRQLDSPPEVEVDITNRTPVAHRSDARHMVPVVCPSCESS